MVADSIKYVSFDGIIWNSVIESNTAMMFLEIRKNNDVQLVRLDLSTLKFQTKSVDHSKWTQLVGAADDLLYFIEYQDENDPNKHEYFSISWDEDIRNSLEKIPEFSEKVKHPHIYESGSEYHKTVAKFLSLDLSLSCEYLEWNDKIIISYYLRSGNEFDRYLLLLRNEDKEFKVCQDKQMKGFSPGSFFVFKDHLIFIKDQNEVCVYTG